MVEENLNSRFIYFITSMVICFLAVTLVVAFLFATDKSWYAEMEGVVLAGGLGNSAGRWLTLRRSREPYRRSYRAGRDDYDEY